MGAGLRALFGVPACRGITMRSYEPFAFPLHAWQHPVVLELAAFYAHHDVRAGDTVHLHRNLQTNLLRIDIERGEGLTSCLSSTGPALLRVPCRPQTPAAADAAAEHAASVAAAALEAGQLAGEAWGCHTKHEGTAWHSSHRCGGEGGKLDASARGRRRGQPDQDFMRCPLRSI